MINLLVSFSTQVKLKDIFIFCILSMSVLLKKAGNFLPFRRITAKEHFIVGKKLGGVAAVSIIGKMRFYLHGRSCG